MSCWFWFLSIDLNHSSHSLFRHALGETLLSYEGSENVDDKLDYNVTLLATSG